MIDLVETGVDAAIAIDEIALALGLAPIALPFSIAASPSEGCHGRGACGFEELSAMPNRRCRSPIGLEHLSNICFDSRYRRTNAVAHGRDQSALRNLIAGRLE